MNASFTIIQICQAELEPGTYRLRRGCERIRGGLGGRDAQGVGPSGQRSSNDISAPDELQVSLVRQQVEIRGVCVVEPGRPLVPGVGSGEAINIGHTDLAFPRSQGVEVNISDALGCDDLLTRLLDVDISRHRLGAILGNTERNLRSILRVDDGGRAPRPRAADCQLRCDGRQRFEERNWSLS